MGVVSDVDPDEPVKVSHNHCCQILARQEKIPHKTTSKNISRYFCSSFQGHV